MGGVYNDHMIISKSDFMRWRVHPALGWINKNRPELLPTLDASTQAIFDTGHDFEQYAEALFPGAVALGFDANDYQSYESLPGRTLKALGKGTVTVFQGRFEYAGFSFIADIVDKLPDGSVDLYEIKSSTSAKPEHKVDLAFQTIVLMGLGYVVRNIGVIHVNGNYLRSGDVNPKEITIHSDVTKAVKATLPDVAKNMGVCTEDLSSPNMPDLSPSLASKNGFNEWLSVYKHITSPDTGSIYDLSGLNPVLVRDMEKQNITRLADIPSDFSLSPKQHLQIESAKSGEPIIDKDNIKEFLSTIKYPVYFLDYETLGSLVPRFDGLRPYQQLPMQYSLHILQEPGGETEHKEFLHTTSDNPARPLVERLISNIGNEGTVLVWYEGFEKTCNTLLGDLLPEHKQAMQDINGRIVDLMVPFKNLWYVDSRFNGSASIKNVLPVLAPELSYKSLDIQEGATAQRLWMEAVLDGRHLEDKDKIMADLLKYCRLDTLAMVEIYKKLKTV
jgi:hypothetical protein